MIFNYEYSNCDRLHKFNQPSNKTDKIKYVVVFVFIPLFEFTIMIARLSYYFSFFCIVGYPLVIQYWKFNTYTKYCLIVLLVFLYIRNYFNFFYSDVWHDAYFNYNTLFGAPNWM